MPGAKVANDAEEQRFSVESVYHEKPMGYHIRDSGDYLYDDVWKNAERRKANFEYCPELVMIMPMKLERERCDGDNMEGEVISDFDEEGSPAEAIKYPGGSKAI